MPSYATMAYMSPAGADGLLFAKTAIEFTSLARIAEQNKMVAVSVHLYTMAIEIAFKSLALRAGATLDDCEKAGHNITKLFALIERFGVKIPEMLDRKLNDPKSFKTRLLGTRYTVFNPKDVITYHKNYFEMLAEILEIPCQRPLKFAGGNALSELDSLVAALKKP
jgi:hypothetical protein